MRKKLELSMTDYLQGTLLTDWTRAVKVVRQVKKWANLGYYVTVDELSVAEACTLLQYLPKKNVDVVGKNGYNCVIRLYGPRVRTPKTETFFVVQVTPEGEPNVSIPLSRDDAYRSASNARGVKSYVCRVEDVIDTIVQAKNNTSSIY